MLMSCSIPVNNLDLQSKALPGKCFTAVVLCQALTVLCGAAGTTYYFLVTGFGGESAGPFSFTIVPSASTQCENPSANQICPVCPNGGEPAAGALFDEDVLCSDAAVDGSILDDGGESCAILQIAGTTICGCPTSQESCPLCPGGEDVANPDLVVLGDGSLTCGVLNSLDGADTCGAVTAGFAAECGCPGTTPCRLCDETATNPNPERLLFNFPPDNAPYTCADAEADIRASAVLNPIEQGCSPSLVDFVTGFDVVDFCCFNGDFPGDLNISNCDSASVITALPFTVSGNTGDATPEVNAQAESCGLLNYGEHQGEWYTYTADANGCVTVRTSGNLDSMLFVYSGECSDLTCVAMNDDAVFTVSGSELTFDAVAGTRYFFMVTGSSSDDVDTYTLEISQIAGNCPSPTGGELCPVCPDGSDPDPTAFYNDDLLCIDAAAEFGVVDGDSQDCVLFQTIGAPICGCEVVAADTCNLCPDGEDVPAVAADKSIPDALTTCSQLNNVAGTSTCGDVTAGVANFCECPSSSPICTLCDASSTMFNPDLVLLEDGNYTCGNANEDTQYYYLWYPLDAEGCNPSIAVSFIDSGINVIDYCCNGGPLTGTLGPTASPATGPTASSDVPTTDSGAGAGSGNTPESTSTSVAVSFRGGIATVSLLCLFVLLN